MKIDSFTKAGKISNEDFVYVCEDFGFVLDGATGLTGEHVTDEKTDARWFSQTLGNFLITNLSKKKSLRKILKQAITFTNQKFDQFRGAKLVVSRPSACIALFRKIGKKIEFFVLGDCTIVTKNRSGDVKILTTQKLRTLDKQNIEIMKEHAKQEKIDLVDTDKYITPFLLKARLSQNTKNGYWILSSDKRAIRHGFYQKVSLSQISQIVGMTDGFSEIFETFNITSPAELCEKISNGEKLKDIYKILFDAQEKDKKCNKFPRFKVRDDASIFVAEF